MKFVEIQGGISVPISNEEEMVTERVKQHGEPFPRNQLSLREQELARQLVHRGVLDRVVIDEKMHFIYNELEDLWG